MPSRRGRSACCSSATRGPTGRASRRTRRSRTWSRPWRGVGAARATGSSRGAEGAHALHVRVRRLPGADFAYPLRVAIAVPSPAGGTRASAEAPREGAEVTTITVDLPSDVRAGAALDVQLEAEAVTYGPRWELGGSLEIVSAEQE